MQTCAEHAAPNTQDLVQCTTQACILVSVDCVCVCVCVRENASLCAVCTTIVKSMLCQQTVFIVAHNVFVNSPLSDLLFLMWHEKDTQVTFKPMNIRHYANRVGTIAQCECDSKNCLCRRRRRCCHRRRIKHPMRFF